MPHPLLKPAAWAAAAVLALAAATASAQQNLERATSLAQIHAIMEYCKVLTPELLEILKKRQQSSARESGVSSLVFDAEYLRAYTKARKDLAEFGEEENELTCQPMRAMAGKE
ncbi:hypothetical protein AXYL_03806 [Achromobacter xylosoxidans A8]|uniref:Secreted protein n=1 Tax=Achromobacter xylosoxidans (strain A8) TaxID=762376 RepID=E3HPW8_ACHXA|nr:hypothetical protein [Achromobacter xylosoxidans]ADP17126.1 hypothetical protein AXYL_03806 [Achromobacter xylosoxidans A8]